MRPERLRTYFSCAREREAIRRRRLAGVPAPWTQDPIFQAWRFCNVHRENDRTTVWFRERVRDRTAGIRQAEAVVAFRWFNLIATGEIVEDLLIDGWDSREAKRRLAAVDGKLFTGAYMINSPPWRPKLDAVLEMIDEARRQLEAFVPTWGGSLRQAWQDLLVIPRMGSFMAYEVVTDLRWTPILNQAVDINTWAASGPGCARGLAWLCGVDRPLAYGRAKDQETMLGYMSEILGLSRDTDYWPAEYQPWEMREVEHWACETDKYVRTLEGRNRPKQKFAPGHKTSRRLF